MSISIVIQQLQGGGREGSEVLDTRWCAEALGGLYTPLPGDISVRFHAERHAEVVQVRVRLAGRFAFRCSRCAERAELEMNTAFSHHFVAPGSLEAGEEVGLFDVDPDVSEHDGERVELRELCIEHVVVALPSYPVCSESCRGLCLSCGTNLNAEACGCASAVDPSSPWAVLKDVRVETKPQTPS